MKEELTRRETLAGVAAVLGAGCSNSGSSPENSSNTNSTQGNNSSGSEDDLVNKNISSENTSQVFDQLLDPVELERQNYVGNIGFQVAFPQEQQEAIPEGIIEQGKNPYLADGMKEEDVLRYSSVGDIETISFDDVEHDELINKVALAGFGGVPDDYKLERGWTMTHAEGSEIESDHDKAEEGKNTFLAIKENEAIALSYPDTNDPAHALTVMQDAIDTHDGLKDSYPEGEYDPNEKVAAMRDFLEEGDLEELENPHSIQGYVEMGRMVLGKAGEDAYQSQEFSVEETSEGYEVNPYTDLETTPYSELKDESN